MKLWNVSKIDKQQAYQLSLDCKIPQIAACVLAARGVQSAAAAEDFLAQEEGLIDPLLMKDMDTAADRILTAVETQERICVYGDYDADGVCSTALLVSFLADIGADVFYYIPSRMTEGYGMNTLALDTIAAKGATLVVTVDNGITALEETQYAKKLGMEIVITDHHKPDSKLPDAVAVVNPHRADCDYPFKGLCGVGVAFKLAAAISAGTISQEELLYEYADLVAIGTVGDIVPLSGENRIFVKRGLEIMAQSPRAGIRALLESALSDPLKLTASRLGFSIVPRINACGRLSSADAAVEMLLSDDETEAEKIAEQLNDDNEQRRSIEKEITRQAVEILHSNSEMYCKSIIVVAAPGWNTGVIGIVASRIREIYGKPAIVMSIEGDTARGSGRSIEGFSLVDAVFSCKEILQHFGGHPMAVGVTLKAEDIDKFSDMINRYADTSGQMPYPRLDIDLKLNPAGITPALVHELEYLQPYGAGNPQPLFGLYGMTITAINEIGGGKHLRLTLSRDGRFVTALYFSHTAEDFVYVQGDVVDLAVTLDINGYNGVETVSIIIRDIKLNRENPLEYLQSLRICEKIKGNKPLAVGDKEAIYPDRAEFALVYREIKRRGSLKTDLSRLRLTAGDGKISAGKLEVIIEAMSELGLISCEKNGEVLKLCTLDYDGKADLLSAPIMKKIQ